MKNFLIYMAAVFFSFNLVAEEKTKVERVGGSYKVTKIERNDQGSFVIDFNAEAQTGKFDWIRLESDHIHMSVAEGMSLRISAEIIKTNENGMSEASQVLLFLPNAVRGVVPVWMLSKKGAGLNLNNARYLEMHVPLSDYTVL